MARVQGYENKHDAKQQAHQKMLNNAAAFKMVSLPRPQSQLRFHSLVKRSQMFCNDMT